MSEFWHNGSSNINNYDREISVIGTLLFNLFSSKQLACFSSFNFTLTFTSFNLPWNA